MKLLSQSHRIKFYLLTLALCFILVFGLLMYDHPKDDFDCSTMLRVESVSSGFDGNFKAYLRMQENHTGYFDISGKVIVNGIKYNVERAYHFNYDKKKNNVYHLTNITPTKRYADDMIDSAMQKVFFNPTSDFGRYIRIQKMKNTYVVKNLYSPSFICISGKNSH